MYVNRTLEGDTLLEDEFGDNAPTHVDYAFMNNGNFILITDDVMRVYEDGDFVGTKGSLDELGIPRGIQAAFQMSDSDFLHGRANLLRNYVLHEYKMNDQSLVEKGNILVP